VKLCYFDSGREHHMKVPYRFGRSERVGRILRIECRSGRVMYEGRIRARGYEILE
jgi:hypothetical protein